MRLTIEPAALPELRRAVEYDRHPGEHRTVGPLEQAQMRDASGTGDGTYTFTGTAVVYDTWTTLYEGRFFDGTMLRIRERVLPGALTKVLASGPEVHLNHGHDMKTSMARLQVVGEQGEVSRGGLKLWETARGLSTFARLNPDLSHVRDLKAQMDDGIIDQMSFAFRIGAESYEVYTEGEPPDATEVYDWSIAEVSALFDVCACAQGAYPTTSAQIRSALAALPRHPGSDPGGDPARQAAPAAGGHAVTAPPGGEFERARRVAVARARARVISLT